MPLEQTKSVRKIKPRYETSTGEWVPGVTTIISIRSKEALVGWAFKVGKEHPELPSIRAYTDELAEIGSCAHEIIGANLKDETPDLSDYSDQVQRAAAVPVSKFLEWRRGKKIELIASEAAYVSEVHRFGGTLDILARIDGVATVLDLKTGKAIYPEYFYQCAAYAELVKEVGGLQVDAIRILQIGRTGAEGFTERSMTDWSLEWQWFLAARALYQAERDLETPKNKKIA